jgi:hypothetical protein
MDRTADFTIHYISSECFDGTVEKNLYSLWVAQFIVQRSAPEKDRGGIYGIFQSELLAGKLREKIA